jgi:hypothetical protein
MSEPQRRRATEKKNRFSLARSAGTNLRVLCASVVDLPSLLFITYPGTADAG